MPDPTFASIPPRRPRLRSGGADAAAPPIALPAGSPIAGSPTGERQTNHETPSFKDSWRYDLPASIVVVLVALPLCLGIALASGAPLSAGLMAGVIGGIVVGMLSDSQLMVSGPAAGLTAIVLAGVTALGSFPAFLMATIIGGVLQIGLSIMRAGVIGYYFPSAVIRGMLAGIGVILILKQLPHAVGYDANYLGDESFRQPDGSNTFSALSEALQQVQPGAALICLLALFILVFWPKVPALKKLKLMPAPLVVVLTGVGLNELFGVMAPTWVIRDTHLVQLPVAETARDLLNFVIFPDLSALANPETWRLGVTIAIVASLESLLSLEATDKLDPFKRESDTNKELRAQGIGNTICGLVGGLPVTGVIVRSAANIDSGGRTRWSGITHGVLLLVAVLTIPALLNFIPLAALAAILLHTGYKLASPALWYATYRLGLQQFVPFAITVVAIVLTDLLIGIAVGMMVGLFFILSEYLRQPALIRVSPPDAVLQRYELPDQATFLSKANIERTLESFQTGSRIEIDGRNTKRFDHDVLELLHDFIKTSELRGIDYRMVGIPPLTTPSPGGH
jgi:MFS superfamily sulfate permease-like transporter